MRLNIGRFDNSTNALIKWVPDFETLGVRCSLPGWLQRLEWTERKDNYFASFDAYRLHLGQRAALIDDWLFVIVDGWVYEVIPDGLHVHYIAEGAWKRHSDQYYTTAPDPTDTVDTVIEAALASVPAISTDYSNINASTDTTVGYTWWTDARTDRYGKYPADIITELMAFSDTSNRVYDYWCQSRRQLDGATLKLPFAQLQPRTYTAALAWDIRRENLRDDPRLGRNIYGLATRTTAYYTPAVTLSAGASKGGTVIVMTAGDLTAIDGSVEGITLRIELDSGRWQTVTGQGSPGAGTISVQPMLSDSAAAGKVVQRTEPLKATTTDTDSAAEAAYWRRDYAVWQPALTSTGAAQFRDMYAAVYNEPVSQHAFTVTSKTMRVRGAEWPAWYFLRRPSNFRINDLAPGDATFTGTLDRMRQFWPVSADYDGQSLRLVPDTEDSRLDVMLKRAGIISGEMVGRGGAAGGDERR